MHHLVTCGYVQCDKDGGHTIWSAIAIKPHAARKLHGSMFYRTGLIANQSFTLRKCGFSTCCSGDLDLDLVTFKYKLDLYSLKVYRLCEYEFPTSRLFKFIIWHTYKHTRDTGRQTEIRTDRTEIIYRSAL